MITKLSRLLEDGYLYEGLIYSENPYRTQNYLSRWTTAKKKFRKIRVANFRKIIITFSDSLTNDEVESLFSELNRYGWYISDYMLNVLPFTYIKYDKHRFGSDIREHKLLSMVLEAKYDVELTAGDLKELYHVSPLKYKEKILKIGLIPKTLGKISYHPERVYLAKTLADVKKIEKMFKLESNDTFVIYKIDVDRLLRYKESIRFFDDPNFPGGIYTLSNIPPQFLTVVSSQ